MVDYLLISLKYASVSKHIGYTAEDFHAVLVMKGIFLCIVLRNTLIFKAPASHILPYNVFELLVDSKPASVSKYSRYGWLTLNIPNSLIYASLVTNTFHMVYSACFGKLQRYMGGTRCCTRITLARPRNSLQYG